MINNNNNNKVYQSYDLFLCFASKNRSLQFANSLNLSWKDEKIETKSKNSLFEKLYQPNILVQKIDKFKQKEKKVKF